MLQINDVTAEDTGRVEITKQTHLIASQQSENCEKDIEKYIRI